MYVLRGIPVVTMGYSIDPLDVCYGDQLAGFVTLGIYAYIGVSTRFRIDSPVESLGHSLKFFVLVE